ncbi:MULTISPECIES: class I SAM-dependent methyltransferase [Providencia]|uniref:Methyltransferase domain-containing protein n=2 Tax=Providencia TaxID=586 RepID=A0AA42FKM8_9GAMM|nr:MULTISPECIES: methyltransferase domain-containing protein [Providencia]APC10482.1 Methyltransferase domain protein [Providencia rettgeri]AVL74101.1 methyltransferase domain-containing protein [Providencia rettgeri]EIL1984723.1 methyltransferase domain-containing protein [Providencia rettgeri]EIU7558437.1 methyltransferase domain-containing protein [Providencia rettgeri]EIU9517142.1 methyltransferase domain-containing protein [Providencia rettgeri]
MKPARIDKKLQMPVSWCDIPFGEQYRQSIENQLRPWWPKIFGFHLLKLGHLSTEIQTQECLISHQFNVGNNDPRFNLIAQPGALPFTEKSIDACLMAHCLAYDSDPHWLLREVDRVLIDDGWLVISGFNPFSLAGLAKLVPVLRKRQPYCSRFFPALRVFDWLSLLNYEVLYHRNCHVIPWMNSHRRINKHGGGIGVLSVIVARKRTYPLTPTPLKFKQPKVKIGTALGAAKELSERTKVNHNR